MNKQQRRTIYICVFLALLVIFIVVFVMVLINSGENLEITGELPQVQKVTSLSCNKSNAGYSFFEYDESISKNIVISATFNDSDELDNVSLRYILYYDAQKKITDSENLNHIALNKSFAEDGLGFDALNAQYSRGTDFLQLSLTANADKLNNVSAKYFMLNDSTSGKYTKTLVEKGYKNKGFSCTTKNN